MEGYIDLFTKSSLFGTIALLLIIAILVFISSVINRYISNIFILVLLVYIIYFPIGVFVCIYYRIISKKWLSIENDFTLIFLYCTSAMIILIISKYLFGILRNRNFKESIFLSRYYLESKLEMVTFSMLYINIAMGIYTFICFYKILVRWIK